MPAEEDKWLMVGAAGAGLAIAGLLSKPTGQSAVPTFQSAFLTPPNRFGETLAAHALADVGVAETGSNTGPRVDAMLANYGQRAVNWCAAAVGTWIRESSAALGVPTPIPGSAGAKDTMRQFQDRSNPKVGWLAVEELRRDPSRIRAGMVPVWTRGQPGSWMGHIGVCVGKESGGAFPSVEGNAGPNGDRVVQAARRLDADSLLGMGVFYDNVIFGTRLSGPAGLGYPNDPAGVSTFSSVETASSLQAGQDEKPLAAASVARLQESSALRYAAIGVGALTLLYAFSKFAERRHDPR